MDKDSESDVSLPGHTLLIPGYVKFTKALYLKFGNIFRTTFRQTCKNCSRETLAQHRSFPNDLPNIATLSVRKEKCGCFTFCLTCEKFFVVHDRAEFHMPLFGSRSTNLRRDKQNNMTFFTTILFRKNIEKRKRENVQYKSS